MAYKVKLKSGDTITLAGKEAAPEPLPGYREPKPMVWSGLFPADGSDYADLRDALDKLKLSDAALYFEPETSTALGFGFRCGFLGLLHMDIVKERLEREFDLELIATAPNVEFHLIRGGEMSIVHNPAEMPAPGEYDSVEEPIVLATIPVVEGAPGALRIFDVVFVVVVVSVLLQAPSLPWLARRLGIEERTERDTRVLKRDARACARTTPRTS